MLNPYARFSTVVNLFIHSYTCPGSVAIWARGWGGGGVAGLYIKILRPN